jgi:GH24 family phage-related lysozyme (muramidase)
MYDSVRNAFIGFTTNYEGRINWMYLDIKGLVTIGIGNLIDPVELAVGLPMVQKSGGAAASEDDIRSEWATVKGHTELAQQGWRAAGAVTNLTISDADIDTLVLAKLEANATALKNTSEFSGFESWPADAQLGILSMAWGLGPGFGPSWPHFRAACGAGDWNTAAAQCRIDETGNPGVRRRNDADQQLFQNAAAAVASGADLSTLWYPNSPPAAGGQSDGDGDGGGGGGNE